MQNREQKSEAKILVRSILIIGDSLSDRGVFYRRRISKLMVALGQQYPSPSGRFADGYVWPDYLAISFVNKFILKDFKNNHKQYDSTDIADGVITNDIRMKKAASPYHLNDPLQIRYQNKEFIRTYCEGGLCNNNYKNQMSLFKHLQNFARLVIPYLSDKIAMITNDDKHRTQQNKQETLVLLWSGANDIGLANDAEQVDYALKVQLAINTIEKSIKELIKSGYQHFLLFDLAHPHDARLQYVKAAKNATQYFNEKLMELAQNLKKEYSDCHFDLFKISAQLEDLVNHPESYNLDKSKGNKAYLTSPEFKAIKNKKPGDPQPAKGYLFWDTVHPTTHVHSIIASKVEDRILEKYEIQPPIKSELSLPSELIVIRQLISRLKNPWSAVNMRLLLTHGRHPRYSHPFADELCSLLGIALLLPVILNAAANADRWFTPKISCLLFLSICLIKELILNQVRNEALDILDRLSGFSEVTALVNNPGQKISIPEIITALEKRKTDLESILDQDNVYAESRLVSSRRI